MAKWTGQCLAEWAQMSPFSFLFGQVGELPLIRLSVCQSIREATKKNLAKINDHREQQQTGVL